MSLYNKALWLESYTELWRPGSYSYESEDYTELADKLDAQICEEDEVEERVCCARDQIKVCDKYVQQSIIFLKS